MKVFLLLAMCFVSVRGHGRLIDPVSRNSMWRYGFSNPTNYDDTALYCGGFENQLKQGGKCGPCGDPWQGPRLHEAGGRYANGIITKTYKQGQVIDVTVELTARHLGWMEFRLCPWNNPKKPVSQECLDAGVLQLADGSGSKVYIDDTKKMINARLQLPSDVSCKQCVLQWWYHTGNSWGCDGAKRCCLGCGVQEQFMNCADVAITTFDNTGNTQTEPPRTSASSTTNRPTTKTTTTTRPRTTTPIASTTTTARTTRPRTTTRIPRTTTTTTATTSTRFTTTSTAAQRTSSPMKKTECRVSNGIWRAVPGMSAWCKTNCAVGNCPASHCTCG